MKILRTENENDLKIERIHYVNRYSLTLDKNLCKGCEICKIVCPREAVELKMIPKSYHGEKAKSPVIDVSEERCSYCGMCDAICPFGAIKVGVDNEHVIPVIRTESFPLVIREIEVDTTKCEVGCSECEKYCPLGLIKVRRMGLVERARELLRSRKREDVRPIIDVKLDSCAGCRQCEVKCPQKAIYTRKIFHGTIKINSEKCPRGCHDCLDVCPIPGALYLKGKKVHTSESYCIYCGVCKIVCPVEGALELKRTYIRHTPVRSGAWNKALEKLTSTKELTKELQVKSLAKAREAVQRRFESRAS